MSCLGCRCPPSFSFALGALSAGPPDPSATDIACHAAGFPGGHTPICATSGMGRMDCPRVHNSDNRLGGGDVRDEANVGIAKGTEEEDR